MLTDGNVGVEASIAGTGVRVVVTVIDVTFYRSKEALRRKPSREISAAAP